MEKLKILKNKKVLIPLLCLFLLSGLFGNTEPNNTNINTEDSQIVMDSETTESDSSSESEHSTQIDSNQAIADGSTSNSESNSGGGTVSTPGNNGSQTPGRDEDKVTNTNPTKPSTGPGISIKDIPAYSGVNYVKINNNIPNFDSSMLSTECYEYYSELDSLGRCGVTYACVGKEIMPTEDRESIGHIKPTGWHTVKYNDLIDGNYLYNRCHLIGFQLTGENANEKNLITGTRQFNVEGMLPFENMVALYVRSTGNHVMYRVTPIFEGRNLLASGVQMEAYSVEDNGRGLSFNVFVYNVQDGIVLDYATGKSWRAETTPSESESEDDSVHIQGKYAVNGNNGKIHIVGVCSATKEGSAQEMENPVYFDTYEEALAYSEKIAPKLDKRQCGNCW